MFTNHPFKAIVVAALIVIALLVTLSLAPISKSAIIPVTGNQSAYSAYLSGEKAYYSNALASSESFSAWQAGEKFITNYDPVKYHFGDDKHIR